MKKVASYLVITELFLPTKGGSAVWFAEVYRRLGGKDIHIVTADVDGAEAVDLTHPNQIHRLDLKRKHWLRPESLFIYIKLFVRSLSLLSNHRFSAVHAGRALPEGLVAWLTARIGMLPVVIYAHGEELTSWGRGAKYQVMRFVLRHADKVVANSDYTREELLRIQIADERIVLINPGVDIERFQPNLPHADLLQGIGVTHDSKLLLSVGRLSRRKGFDKLIESMPELLKRGIDVRYAVIGIGEDRKYLADKADTYRVMDRVHFLGHVSPDVLPRWYNACDIFVMPNREINGDTEGFGMVYIEAAACGKSTIAGLGGGTGSAVLHGETGLRVDGTDVGLLTEALAGVLTDDDLRLRMGAVGLERVTKHFSWEKVAEKTRAMLP